MSVTVEVQRVCRLDNIPDDQQIRSWVAAAVSAARKPVEVTVRIVDDDEGAHLNRTWRHTDGATNVLSFPATGVETVAPGLLGDIVICAPLVAREANRQAKTLSAHWAHMVIHGTLHLQGYDHESEPQAKLMENREVAILEDLGFANPYLAK